MYKKSHNKIIIWFLLYLIFPFTIEHCFGQNKSDQTALGTITIDAGEYDRFDTPIRYQCLPTQIFGDPSKFRREGYFYYIGDGSGLALLRDYHLVLIEEGETQTRINVQWDQESGFDWEKAAGKGALIWILEGKTPKKSKRTFKLVLEKGEEPQTPFNVKITDNSRILVNYKNKPVLQYNYEKISEIDDKSSPKKISCYIHPVWTPSGEIITGDYQSETIHQCGIFNAWKRAKFNEIEVNFWDMNENAGKKLPDILGPDITNGPVFAELSIHNKGVFNGNTYMREVCDVKTYSLPEKDMWLFDVHFTQSPVNPKRPMQFPTEVTTATVIAEGKVKRIVTEKEKNDLIMELLPCNEGGLVFRGKNEWVKKSSSLSILTSVEKNEKGVKWVDFTGPISNAWGGIAIFDHPLNQSYPSPVNIDSKSPYFLYNVVKNSSYTASMSNPLELVYRFLVHNGKPDKKLNDQISNDFVNPPKITWQRLDEQ
jgi:hypothetical protein